MNFTRHEVTAIDVRASTVTVRNLGSRQEQSVHDDELLIGTGASGILPNWPGSDAKGAEAEAAGLNAIGVTT